MSIVPAEKIQKFERFRHSRRAFLTAVFLVHAGGRKYKYLGAGFLTISHVPGGIAMAMFLVRKDFMQAVNQLRSCPHKRSWDEYSQWSRRYQEACNKAPTIFLKSSRGPSCDRL